jgi:hypothetical protein
MVFGLLGEADPCNLSIGDRGGRGEEPALSGWGDGVGIGLGGSERAWQRALGSEFVMPPRRCANLARGAPRRGTNGEMVLPGCFGAGDGTGAVCAALS